MEDLKLFENNEGILLLAVYSDKGVSKKKEWKVEDLMDDERIMLDELSSVIVDISGRSLKKYIAQITKDMSMSSERIRYSYMDSNTKKFDFIYISDLSVENKTLYEDVKSMIISKIEE